MLHACMYAKYCGEYCLYLRSEHCALILHFHGAISCTDLHLNSPLHFDIRNLIANSHDETICERSAFAARSHGWALVACLPHIKTYLDSDNSFVSTKMNSMKCMSGDRWVPLRFRVRSNDTKRCWKIVMIFSRTLQIPSTSEQELSKKKLKNEPSILYNPSQQWM